MPLRLFFYISEILREHAKNARHEAYDKSIKIPAVVPLVLYNGRSEWDVPVRFRDIVESEELFGDNIVDFKYNLFDVNNKYSKEELIKNKGITSAIFLLDQKIEPKEFLDRIKTIALFFDSLNEKEMQVLKHWIENSVEDRFAKEAVKILSSSKEEVLGMVASNAFIITEMEKKAEEKGMEKGIEKGLDALKSAIIDNVEFKFNNVPIDVLTIIKDIKDIEKLKIINREILKSKTIDEVNNYLSRLEQ
jgi:hypothetical protein